MDKGQFLLYQTPDGDSQIEVKLQDDTVWLSLDQMAELFQRNKSTISRHIKNVLEDGELEEKSVVAFFATTAVDSKTYSVAYYNLDMIISVGYRVHSKEKADNEYDKFKERTQNNLSAVEIHFLENFEREQKRLLRDK
nr:hypothetical protein [Leyella stercorea]